MLYYGIGKYISMNSREGFWGKGAIDAISERLEKELPGLKGFSARNLRNMRSFYEEWVTLDASFSIDQLNLADASAKADEETSLQIWQTHVPKEEIREEEQKQPEGPADFSDIYKSFLFHWFVYTVSDKFTFSSQRVVFTAAIPGRIPGLGESQTRSPR